VAVFFALGGGLAGRLPLEPLNWWWKRLLSPTLEKVEVCKYWLAGVESSPSSLFVSSSVGRWDVRWVLTYGILLAIYRREGKSSTRWGGGGLTSCGCC